MYKSEGPLSSSVDSTTSSAIQLFLPPDPKSVNTGIGAVIRACANNDMSKSADAKQIFDDNGPEWPEGRNTAARVAIAVDLKTITLEHDVFEKNVIRDSSRRGR